MGLLGTIWTIDCFPCGLDRTNNKICFDYISEGQKQPDAQPE